MKAGYSPSRLLFDYRRRDFDNIVIDAKPPHIRLRWRHHTRFQNYAAFYLLANIVGES